MRLAFLVPGLLASFGLLTACAVEESYSAPSPTTYRASAPPSSKPPADEPKLSRPTVAPAVVRTAEKPEAPLHTGPNVEVSSTVELGYEHGIGTPMFSNGGDSGAGLFLVENGKLTHKLVGVARQPEPARNLDHFTRIDAGFLAWLATSNP